MKKSTILIALAAVAGMFTSCSKDSENLGPDVIDNAKQEIVLQVSNEGDALTATRAGRPLFSEEAKQEIDNVLVIITKDKAKGENGYTVAHVQEITDWKTASLAYNTNGHGREMIITLKDKQGLDKKLPEGSYIVYAIGYSNNSSYAKNTLPEEGKEFAPNTILSLTSGVGEEIFAGSVELKVEAAKGFRPNVVLHRQVAGIFTYLTNIPYYQVGDEKNENKIVGTKLSLYAVAKCDGLVLGDFVSTEVTNNGNNSKVKNVINGNNQTEGETLVYTINLTDWFKKIKDENNDNLIDTDATAAGNGNYSNWQNPCKNSDGSYKATFKKGSVFGGTFLIPFKAVKTGTVGRNTFVLKMTDNTGSHVFQTWVIKLDSKATPTVTADVWETNSFKMGMSFEQSVNEYSIFRNQLYGVGKRVNDTVKPGPNPGPDPNPDPTPTPTPDPEDKPSDINKKHELTLRVNDNWEAIHEMEIE